MNIAHPRLLERLHQHHPQLSKTGQELENKLAFSIKNHILCLLNTRQGSVLIEPQFGLPIFDAANLHLENEAMLELIEQQINRYEPRIKNLNLQIRPSDSTTAILALLINAQLKAVKEQLNEKFELEISALFLNDATFIIDEWVLRRV